MPTLCESAIIAGGLGLGVAGGIALDRITTSPPAPTILNHPENSPFQTLDPNDPINKVWQALQEPAFTGVDGQSRSYRQIMEETGYEVYEAVSKNGELQRGATHLEKGLNVRVRPTTNQILSPILRQIKGGETVLWRGEFSSKNPDGSMHVFGLLIDPNHEADSLTNPTFIAIRTHNRDGTIEWYVDMANTHVKQLADGAIDYGNGIIGPSTTDQNAVNRK